MIGMFVCVCLNSHAVGMHLNSSNRTVLLPGPDMQRIRCMNLEHLVQIAGPRHLLSLFEVYKEGLIV